MSRRVRSWWVLVGLSAVVTGAAAGGLLWWWLDARLGWEDEDLERTAWVATIVAAVVAVTGTIVRLVVWLRGRSAATGRSRWQRRARVVGRLPPPANWYQPRQAGQQLAKAADRGRTTALTQVLSGIGGVGKTQLAAAFARRLVDRGELDLLVWVSASRVDKIVTGYAEAAAVLQLSDGDGDAPRAAGRFLTWLEGTDRRWLVVLDDLTRPGDLTGWWPPTTTSSHGRTLVTTRRRDAVLHGQGRTLLDVNLFTPGEARAYLVEALPGHQRRAEIDKLAADLGLLPLALAQAAAYTRDRGLTCEQYRARLADRRRRLAELLPEEHSLPDEQQATVAATWSLSVEAADQLKPEGLAKPVLNLASVLDPNGIPAAVFTTRAAQVYLATVTGGPVTADDANDALHNLHRLNLLTLDADQGSVRVHALVQRATRDRLADEQTSHAARAAADALLQLWPYPEPDPAFSATLRANTSALHQHTGDALLTPEHPVLFRAGQSLGDTGQVTAAADYHQRLLADLLRVLGPDHPDTLAARNNLASWRAQTGDATGAVEAFEQLLPELLRVLGPDHPNTLVTRNNLARWRGESGDATGAVEAFEQLLSDRHRVLGADHPDTLVTRSDLATWRGRAWDPTGAVEAFEQLLNDRLRILGPDHPHTLATRGNLASWRGQTGDVTGAVEAFEHLLNDWRRGLGPDHPDALATQGNLAWWRGLAGNATKAVDAFEQLLNDRLRVLGPDHPRTLGTRSDLAWWRGQTGDVTGAIETLQELLADMVRVLGADHSATRATRSQLAWLRGEYGGTAGGESPTG